MTSCSLDVETFVDRSFGENAYLLSTPGKKGSRVGWIIDPSFPPQVVELLDSVKRQRIEVERIVLTHGHLDHIAGVDLVREQHPGVPIAIASAESGALADPDQNLSSLMGLPFVLKACADEDLPPGGELRLGVLTWLILDVSGHSPAGRALYCAQAGVVMTGDALFAGSIGRYDFPGSDGDRLRNHIRNHLFSLPEGTIVYSGHGPSTTIGNERKSNPFVAD